MAKLFIAILNVVLLISFGESSVADSIKENAYYLYGKDKSGSTTVCELLGQESDSPVGPCQELVPITYPDGKYILVATTDIDIPAQTDHLEAGTGCTLKFDPLPWQRTINKSDKFEIVSRWPTEPYFDASSRHISGGNSKLQVKAMQTSAIYNMDCESHDTQTGIELILLKFNSGGALVVSGSL